MKHGAMVLDGLTCCLSEEGCDYREDDALTDTCKYNKGEICECDAVRQAIRIANGERGME